MVCCLSYTAVYFSLIFGTISLIQETNNPNIRSSEASEVFQHCNSHICFQTTHFQESEVICQLVLTFYRLSACLLLCLWSIFSKAFENVLELALKCQIAAAALTKLRKQSCFTHVMSEWHFHRSLKINDCTRWKIGEAILLQWLTKKKLIQFGKSRSSGILWLTVTSVLSIPAS